MRVRTKDGVKEMTLTEYNEYAESIKSPEQKEQEKIYSLKNDLRDTDYQSNKAFEKHPAEDWDIIEAQRESWRQEIRKGDLK